MKLLAKQLATAMPTLRAPRVWLMVLNEAMERFEIASSAHIAVPLSRGRPEISSRGADAHVAKSVPDVGNGSSL